MRGRNRLDAIAPVLVTLSSTGLFFGPTLLQTFTKKRLTRCAGRDTLKALARRFFVTNSRQNFTTNFEPVSRNFLYPTKLLGIGFRAVLCANM